MTDQPKIQAFTFGEPEPVLDGRTGMMGMLISTFNQRYYEPPINLNGLAKTLNANTHHNSALQFKSAQVARHFQASKVLAYAEFLKIVKDFLIFGNAYVEKRLDRAGRVIAIKHIPAKFTRRTKDGYAFIQQGKSELHHFQAGTVFHLIEPDVNQEIYGVPTYLGALQSIWLNEAATLFRRKYYSNGSHAGFILYMTDPTNDPSDIDAISTALEQSKGPGNFRNMMVYSPNGKPDGLKVIPISEVMAKDEFLNIKDVTRDDILAAHRLPPMLMGIIPKNAGGFGSAREASQIFYENEIMPIQRSLEAINDWAGTAVVEFEQPTSI